jgi:hypothetical protein
VFFAAKQHCSSSYPSRDILFTDKDTHTHTHGPMAETYLDFRDFKTCFGTKN